MATSNVQLVIFGGTGDLTTRMLMPSLLGLFDTGKLANFAVLILSNRNFTDDDYREFIRPFLRRSTKPDIPGFLQHIFYQTMDVTKATDYTAAATKSHDIDKQFDLGGNRIFYFAVAPRLLARLLPVCQIVVFWPVQDINASSSKNRLVRTIPVPRR